MTTENIIIRTLKPSEGMVITDVETETMRAEIVYLGKEDSPENYKEIDKNTPLPEIEEENIEENAEQINE